MTQLTIIDPKIMRFDYFLFLNGSARYHFSFDRYFNETRLRVRKLEQNVRKSTTKLFFRRFLQGDFPMGKDI